VFQVKEVVSGKYKVSILFKDGVCEYDAQFEDFKSDYRTELVQIESRIRNDLAEGQLLPKTKFRTIPNFYKGHKVYEIKTKRLRVYLIQDSNHGKIIAFMGKKSNQEKDYRKLKALMELYFENQ
jgi:hypothetical protein